MLYIQEQLMHVLRVLQADLLFKSHRLFDNFHFFTASVTRLTSASAERQFDALGAADS